MSTHSNTFGSLNFDVIPFDQIWEYINDPVEDQIVSQIRSQIQDQEMEDEQERDEPAQSKRCRRYIGRDRQDAENRLQQFYFSENPMYTDAQFRRRYRMKKDLFLRIVQKLSEWSPVFQQRADAFGKIGFSPLLKCTLAMRMLAYGTCADMFDENLQIAESTAIESLKHFCNGIIENFGQQYLRRPTTEDIQRLLHVAEARGFPGMLGSIDCMHWEWKNCPVAWKGMYTRGCYGVPTVMLEAVASHDLWIWHAYFGAAGSNNDINVLNQSPLFTAQRQGIAPDVNFTVNGNEYNMGYYLADGIYPEWAAFVKTIKMPHTAKHRRFAERQESVRKDVECAFGVLQSRFAMLRTPARMWSKRALGEIMYACIIMHNMIVEDERDSYEGRHDFGYEGSNNFDYEQGSSAPPLNAFGHGPVHGFQRVLETGVAIRDRKMHRRLKDDLVEHIWGKFGPIQPEQA